MEIELRYQNALDSDNYFGGGNFRQLLSLPIEIQRINIAYNGALYRVRVLADGRLYIGRAEKNRLLNNNGHFILDSPPINVDALWNGMPLFPEFENENIPNDEDQRQAFARRIRRGQAQFRRILLAIYGQRCCISGCGIQVVLEACHIESHAANGLNSIGNGILLRSDLHTLFDEGYLYIEPNSLRVHIHPELENSDYWVYNGQVLRNRHNDAAPIDIQLLETHWNGRDW